MAIEITAYSGSLKRWVASKNPFELKVEVDEYVTTAGAKWKESYNVTTGASDGDTISFDNDEITELYGGPIEFMFQEVEPSTMLRIFAYVDTEYISRGEWIDKHVIPALLSHPYLGEHYTITRTSNSIVITANEYGPDWELTVAVTGDIAISPFGEVAGAIPEVNSNLKMMVKVHVNSAFTATGYNETPWFPYDLLLDDDMGIAHIDISEQIDAMIKGEQYPMPATSWPWVATVASRKMFVTVGAKDIVTGEWVGTVRTPTLGVIKGGYRTNDLDYEYGGPAEIGDGINSAKFLTNRPPVVYTHRSATDFLSFHLWEHLYPEEDGTDCRFKVKVYYTDGTSVEDDLHMFVYDALQYTAGTVITLPAGFDQLDLGSLSALGKPYKYDLMIAGAPEDLTQTFYLVEDTDMGYSVIYINDYGVPEGLYCEGARSTSVQHERETVEMQRPISKKYSELMLKESSIRTLQPSLDLVSYPLLKKEWTGMLGAFLSPKMWIHYGLDSTPIPAQLVPGTLVNESINWEGNAALHFRFRLELNKDVVWSDLNNILK